MTLTDQKGNIRGREFPTDTGIDGNACESLSLSLSLLLSILSFLSFSLSRSSSLALPLFLFFSPRTLSLRTNSPHLASPHPSIHPYDPLTTYMHRTQYSLPRTVAVHWNKLFPRWGYVQELFPVETIAATDSAPQHPSLTARCLMIPGTSKSTRPIPIR